MSLRRRDVLKLGAVALVPACAGRSSADRLENPAFSLPRITSNEDFYVVSYDAVPSVDAAAWRLLIDGLVSSPLSLSLDELRALPLREKEHTLQCIGASPRNNAISNAMWTGVPLQEVLAASSVSIDASARYLHLYSADAYLNQLDRSDLDDREVWLVVGMNGAPLPPEHGFPARLLVSNRYGYKNPKWLERISFAAEPVVGTWQALGYPDDGTNRPAGFVALPTFDDVLADAPLSLVGSAFCGGVAIDAIELSRDNGVTWEAVEITFPGAPDVWTLWRYDFDPAGPGDYLFLLRVRSVDGRSSLATNPNDNAGWQGYGRIGFTIAG